MTKRIKELKRDLHLHPDVEVCAEIKIFDIFRLTLPKLKELYKKCLAFSYKVSYDDMYSETAFYSNDEGYPLLKFRKKKIILLKLKRDISVFEIKALAEASGGNFKKLETMLDSEPLLHFANFILAGPTRPFTFMDRHNEQSARDKREIIESYRYGNAHYPILFISDRPGGEIIKKGCHVAWLED